MNLLQPEKLTDLQWAVLRVLSMVRESTTTIVHQALLSQWPENRRSDVSAAMHQLEARQLVRCNDERQWTTTAAGQALATAAPAGMPARGDRLPSEHEMLARTTPCRPRRALGTGDARPPVLRPGAEQALALPSRMGGVLCWRDGKREVA